MLLSKTEARIDSIYSLLPFVKLYQLDYVKYLHYLEFLQIGEFFSLIFEYELLYKSIHLSLFTSYAFNIYCYQVFVLLEKIKF